MSRGEERIELYLQRHNIKHKQWEDIKTPIATGPKKLFNVDFVLTDEKDNIKMIIEYNGKQHYESVSYMGGDDNFAAQQARDAALRRYCETEGIRLLEIPYTDFDRIEEILDREL
jgi:DNA-binding LacI/PurR family transcriptional regulator